MKECCEILPDLDAAQRRVLRVVLWINVAMFVAEVIAGVIAHSTALIADSVDMLGDAIVYGVSLYAIGRGVQWQARTALLKGGVMALFGVGILIEVVLKLARDVLPSAEAMGVMALVALAANSAVLLLLSRHRADDINMSSAWVCSRNDVLANISVLLAALGVRVTGSAWPDIVVGLAIAVLFARSAVFVITGARRALQPLA